MYNKLGKIFFGFLGVVVLLFGGISWGQEPIIDGGELDEVTTTASATTPKAKCVVSQGNWIGNDTTLGICECPDNTTLIDGRCESCDKEGVCCGVKLNTKVPFIGNCIELDSKTGDSCKENSDCGGGGTCIHQIDEQGNFSEEGVCQYNNDSDETKVTDKTAFPLLMGGLTKMMVTVILLMSFILILVGGVMISASGSDDGQAREGKKLIGKVLIGIALLGASGVILRLINPHFFG